jgi:hypothetical protein
MLKIGKILVFGLTTALFLGGAAEANAASVDTHPVKQLMTSRNVTNSMTRIGFDSVVAQQHGYLILTLSDGAQVSILASKLKALGAQPSNSSIESNSAAVLPKRNVSTAGISPDNYVYGDCGDSYYFLGVYSDGSWSSITGYDVTDSVSEFVWWTGLEDPSGSQIESKEYGYGPTGASWEGTDSDGAGFLSQHGTYFGYVSSGTVLLNNGSYCTSGDPGDTSTY